MMEISVHISCHAGELKSPQLPPKIEKDLAELKGNPNYQDGVLRIPVTQEAIMDLNQHWADQGFSGLMAAVASEK